MAMSTVRGSGNPLALFDELEDLLDCNLCNLLNTPRKFAKHLKEKAIEAGILGKN